MTVHGNTIAAVPGLSSPAATEVTIEHSDALICSCSVATHMSCIALVLDGSCASCQDREHRGAAIMPRESGCPHTMPSPLISAAAMPLKLMLVTMPPFSLPRPCVQHCVKVLIITKHLCVQECLDRAAMIPAALNAVLYALQPAAAVADVELQLLCMELFKQAASAIFLDAIFDAVAVIVSMVRHTMLSTAAQFLPCTSARYL